MSEPNWVLLELVLAVHQMLLAEHGGSAGIRDQGLLESAFAEISPTNALSWEIVLVWDSAHKAG